MKYLLTLMTLICNSYSFSQTPNLDLYQTWYLYNYYSTDDNIHHPVSAMSPPISPRITFTTTTNYNGQGACNSFGGTFSSPYDNYLSFNNFSATLLLCGSTNHISFENDYFFLMQGDGQYYISGQGDNMNLLITTPIFNNYVFGNRELHVSGTSRPKIG